MKKLLYFLFFALPFCGLAQTLQLEATSNKPDILTGETLTYTFKYTCSSTTSACTNVTLVAGAPSGIVFPAQTIALTADILSYSISPDSRTINFIFKESLAAGSTGIITVTGQGEFGLADGTTATLTAELKSGATVGSSKTIVTTLHSTNKFCASKSNGVGLLPGGITTYQISMGYQSNGYSTSGIGVTSVTNISLVDQLPMGAIIESVTLDESFNAPGFVPAPAGTCVIDNANSRFTCTFPADYLKVQSNFTPIPKINVAVRYPEGLFTAPNPVTNSVVFKYTPLGGSEITLSNGDSRTYADGVTYPATGSLTCPARLSVTDNLASPILKLETKKWKPVNSLKLGQTSYFSLPVFNRGNVALENVVVEDIIPSEITVITVNPAKFINIDAGSVVYEAKTVNNPTYTPIVFTPNYWQIPEGDRLTHIRMTIPSMPPNSGTSEDYEGIQLNYRVNDDAVAPGSFQNCMTSTTTTAGVDLLTANSCVTITLLPKDQFSNISVDKRVVKSPMSLDNFFYSPAVSGDIAWMFIQAGNDLGGQPLSNPVVMDLLPLGLLYENDIQYAAGTPAPSVTDVIPNYNGTGRTLIRLKWNTPLESGGILKFSIKTKISNQLPGGDPGTVPNWTRQPYLDGPGLKNTAFFTGSSPSQCLIPEYESIGSVAAKDIYDLDGDGSTADTLCYDTGGAAVASSASMESVKWVKGECDTTYSKFPDFGSTMPGGLANYKLIVKNNGNVSTKAIEIFDILPYIGDTGVKDLTPRETAWRPNLVTPIATPTGVTVFYTTVQNPCRPDYVTGGPAGCNPPNWTTVLPSDPTTVQGLKFDFGTKVLKPGDEIELTWDMRAPTNAPTNNEIAWNSFGFKATRADNNDPFLPAEPNKVGIKVKPIVPGAYGDFVWIDTNKNGIQDAGEPGIDGVRVELRRDNGDGIADPKNDELVSFTSTGNGGRYLFPNLKPDNYFAVFFVPAGYSSSPANVATPGDSLDSDGIATICNGNRVTVTGITDIAALETDLRWDQGVFVDKAALGNYVWFDQNQNNIQDESTTNGVNGVIVCLYRDVNNNGTAEPDAADGVPVARDTTGSDIYGRPGYYLFENLEPGKYFVKFKLATGQTFTTNSGTVNGSSDPSDSDPNATTGVTEVTDLTAGEVDLTWDAGIIIQTGPYNLGNFVWSDINNNGKADPFEPGINGVSVILYEDRNNNSKPDPDEYVTSTTTTTVTGIVGTYTFTNLPGGNYIVQIPDANFLGPLKDFVSSTGNDPAPDPDDNIENDDNGSAVTGCGIISKPITLANNAEPLDGGITNYSVDFGFYKCTKPNYKMEVIQPTCAGGKGSILLGPGTGGDKVAFTTGDITTIPTYANATLVSSLAGGVIVGNISNPASDVTYLVRIYNGEDGCYKDFMFTIKPLICCTKPVAVATPKTQTICVGGTITSYTTTPSAGIEYQWYGPLADTTGSLGTAISGQTLAAYTPTGAALTSAGTKYYAVIVNTTGDITCADTAFVQLIVNAKPNIADGTAAICAGESVDLTSKITNYAALLSPVWTVATAGGTAVTAPTAVKPTATTTYVLVAQNASGCKDTANVVVTVNPKPNAGKDTTMACVNPATNTLATSITLAPTPSGGTFTQIGTTPATATINGNAVTNMTVAGTYQFVYTTASGCKDTIAVTVQPCTGCVKPDAGPDAPAVCQPVTTAKLTAVTAGGTWAAQSGNPATASIDAAGNITGLSAAGTYKFIYSVTGGGIICTDTAQVVVNAKPNIADGTAAICAGESVDLTSKITNYAALLSPVWTVATAGGTAVTAPTAVKPTATTTYVLVAQNASGCKDTANVVVTVNPKPTITVANGFPACRQNGTAYTIKFVATGGTVTTVPGLTVTGDSIANIPLTTASVKLIITGTGGCKDSIIVTAPVCNQPVGSIGDLIWKDANDNGLQDLLTEKGVAGVKVNLYAAAAGTKTGAVLQTKTTGTDGLYLFTGLLAGDYIVEIDKTSLKDTCVITAKQNVGNDDTKDSDFNPTSGLSQVITLAPVFNPTTPSDILKTNNLTVDAGLVVPCIKSKVTVTAGPVCSADVQTYSLSFSVSNKVGTVKVNNGVLTGTNPYTVTGIPSGTSVKITDSLSAVCKFDTLITGPNCNCNPPLPVLVTPTLTACIGDTFPTIKTTVVGLATVEWFTQPTGGTAVFTGLNFKPTGLVTAGGAVFYAQARSTDPACPAAISTSRVMATVNAQNCTVTIDLALKKAISKKIAQLGDELTYTLKVFNQQNTAATGVEVTDSLATTVQFVTGSFTASRGSATITGNVIKWTIGDIAANAGTNGDTVTLVYKVKAILPGIHLNTAEISKTNEKDIDSTPGNGKAGEDDIESQCFTVPIKLCPSEKVQASVPENLTNVQWFRNGETTPIASGNTVLLTQVGTYTFTATNQTCPANGCCPVIIEPGANCCPEDLCIPFTVKKLKKN
ncbi:SdrD B-like domain-containing protein [Runella slithyformis]|uniref:Conserved repeat domain protein n=1 Tax=Runella slithyformis (strain ATCC 29530 / DSM 19594 / LMG 11500 / NCIMB 11436 / LSU 4) TaxID=761193 RepID=A0A7U3ZQ96_RUNSL|nr:SdrD B-like domain-containing protein [Runella slithyformis]AEI51338.1 conserved repeat domain protein [Runella slithyformis DSM 19594]